MKKIFLFFCLSLIASLQVAFANRGEDGIATFYGDNFHGRKTSSNELYDKDQLTAAHRSLPYGTIVRVTVLATGATVDVRINDRGPFVKGRIITVSKKAAEILNILKETDPVVKLEVVQKTAPVTPEVTQNVTPETGTTPTTNTPTSQNIATTTVEKTAKSTPTTEIKSTVAEKTTKTTTIPDTKATETKNPAVVSRSLNNSTSTTKNTNYVKEASKMTPGSLYKMQVLQMEEKGYGVQIAGYSDYEAVYNQLSILQENHFKGGMVFVDELNGKNFYKVILGPFFTKEEASSYSQNLRTKHGMKDAFVVDLSALNKKAQTTTEALTPDTAPKTNAKVITTKK